MYTGQFVTLIASGERYLFLGHVGNNQCVIADKHGNKIEVYLHQIKSK